MNFSKNVKAGFSSFCNRFCARRGLFLTGEECDFGLFLAVCAFCLHQNRQIPHILATIGFRTIQFYEILCNFICQNCQKRNRQYEENSENPAVSVDFNGKS